MVDLSGKEYYHQLQHTYTNNHTQQQYVIWSDKCLVDPSCMVHREKWMESLCARTRHLWSSLQITPHTTTDTNTHKTQWEISAKIIPFHIVIVCALSATNIIQIGKICLINDHRQQQHSADTPAEQQLSDQLLLRVVVTGVISSVREIPT